MPHTSLIARLKNHEDNFIERKPEGVNASEIRQSIVAFANSVPAGATAILFMGIHNDGRIQGVENPDKLQKTVRDQCEKVCYPPVVFSTAVLNIEDKAVVAIVVPPSQNRPHFSGPAFVRRGSESVAASPEMFEDLIVSRSPLRQNSCRLDKILNMGATRTKDGTVRRSIQEQSGGANAAAGERRSEYGG